MRKARFYQAYRFHESDGCIVSWHRLKRDAKQAIANDLADESQEFVEPCGVIKCEVTLSTDGIIEFLNDYCWRDN